MSYLKFQFPERVGMEEVVDALGISHEVADYWLRRLVKEGSAEIEVEVVEPPELEEWRRTLRAYEAVRYPSVTDRYLIVTARDKIRELLKKVVRRVFYKAVVEFYYRTSYAELYYAEDPRIGKDQTPDPISEIRVTVVSDAFGTYKEALERMRDACIQAMMSLAPQTFWKVQSYVISAYEDDEMIDRDEIPYSVPVYQRLNFAERYAIFFKSRQRPRSKWWRATHPSWWETGEYPERDVDYPRDEDYEYDEKYIATAEERAIAEGRVRTKFNNETAMLEAI